MAARRRGNWLVAAPLYALTGVLAMAGALIAYWLVHEVMGYYGGKSVVFYVGGMVAGAYVAWPLWWLYRRRYPKAGQEKQENS
jgi:hypothetical protein